MRITVDGTPKVCLSATEEKTIREFVTAVCSLAPTVETLEADEAESPSPVEVAQSFRDVVLPRINGDNEYEVG